MPPFLNAVLVRLAAFGVAGAALVVPVLISRWFERRRTGGVQSLFAPAEHYRYGRYRWSRGVARLPGSLGVGQVRDVGDGMRRVGFGLDAPAAQRAKRLLERREVHVVVDTSDGTVLSFGPGQTTMLYWSEDERAVRAVLMEVLSVGST